MLTRSSTTILSLRCSALRAFSTILFGLLLLTGCQKTTRTDDPQLKPIQDMLDQGLPVGTPEANLITYLETRGYTIKPAEKQGTVLAIIRHIDTQRLEPVTVRVTFYFDATHRLNTYEMQRTLNEPIPQ